MYEGGGPCTMGYKLSEFEHVRGWRSLYNGLQIEQVWTCTRVAVPVQWVTNWASLNMYEGGGPCAMGYKLSEFEHVRGWRSLYNGLQIERVWTCTRVAVPVQWVTNWASLNMYEGGGPCTMGYKLNEFEHVRGWRSLCNGLQIEQVWTCMRVAVPVQWVTNWDSLNMYEGGGPCAMGYKLSEFEHVRGWRSLYNGLQIEIVWTCTRVAVPVQWVTNWASLNMYEGGGPCAMGYKLR